MKEIPTGQVDARLAAENPWWEDPNSSTPSTDLTPRPYLELFMPLVSDRSVRRAVILMGPRRVGKTILIHHAIHRLIEAGVYPKKICYVSIDVPLYNGLGLEDILSTYQRVTEIDIEKNECYFFFDEIQYLRNWEVHVKTIVDRYENAKFVASGSAAAALRLKSNESGAGRFTDFILPPLTFYEYLMLLGENELITMTEVDYKRYMAVATDDIHAVNNRFVDYLNFGGYPEVALSPTIQQNPGRFVKSDIIDKVLLRDLPSLYGIQDVQELNYLFTTLAFNTANEVSLEQLSQGSGVTKSTIKRYIEYLEAAFLVRVVHRVDRSAKRFKRANFFKIYLTNPSISTALFSPIDSEDERMGALVETAIYSQWFHSDLDLHYARWDRGEVDIVCLGQDQKVTWAVEAKWSDRFYENPRELKSLISFCHKHNLAHTLITTRTKSGEKIIDNTKLNFQPSALYCYTLGYNIVSEKKLSRQRNINPEKLRH